MFILIKLKWKNIEKCEMKNNFIYVCNLLLIKIEIVSNKCMLIEFMFMFDKL